MGDEFIATFDNILIIQLCFFVKLYCSHGESWKTVPSNPHSFYIYIDRVFMIINVDFYLC